MNRFENAIRQAGGFARLPGGGEFAASVQAERIDGQNRVETGAGHIYTFSLYTSCDGDASLLREGSVIEYRGERYIVQYIEDACLGGEPVYRRGTVIREQGGDY